MEPDETNKEEKVILRKIKQKDNQNAALRRLLKKLAEESPIKQVRKPGNTTSNE
jgi:hypothetical protein